MRNASSVMLSTLLALLLIPPASRAQDSPMVRLLKGGKVPEARQGTILEMIGKRGDTADLAYVFGRVVEPEGFGGPTRLQALQSLANAALTRKVRPEGDLSRLSDLIRPANADVDEPTRRAAIRLAGLWGVEAAGPDLQAIAEAPETTRAVRVEALDALVALGGANARATIDALTGTGRPWGVRLLAVAALAKLDPDAATAPALALLADVPPDADVSPIVAAFLGKQGGADRLAAAVDEAQVAPDVAKLALRALYAIGRTDASLVTALSKAAGLDAEVVPLDEAQMQAMIAEVKDQGDAARGEAVFRRVDLNCTQCHALAGAGGGIGPELSAVGSASPPDYLINAVLQPDQAIKEEYETLVILTNEGQIVQGIVKDRDTDRLVIKDATGTMLTLPLSEIEESRAGGSLMPKGLPNLMTHAEFVDLVRFLSELGKPGPYGQKPVPTIQRWRVLRDSGSTVDPAGLPAAGSDGWVPAYATYSGVLPLEPLEAIAGGPVVMLLGEIEVNAAGPVTFRLDSDEGVALALDGTPLDGGPTFTRELSRGRHTLTLRVETAQRAARGIRVEVVRPDGSTTEVAVVGGN